MDPQTVFCPNSDCPARGRIGAGNIGVHSRKERRYVCHECNKTFAETKGTALYRLRTEAEQVSLVVTLLAHGCPIQAIVAAFELDERTVMDWQTRAGQQAERVHERWVEQPRDLGQVQADEIRVKKQGGVVWMAMALQVSTRLWLGGVLGTRRDFSLIAALLSLVRACAVCRPWLLCVDGFSAYVRAFQQTFRDAVRTGQPGRPRLRLWEGLCLGQMVKQYARKRVVAVTRRIALGTVAQVESLLQRTQTTRWINTAYIERLNATFRARLATLVRRGRSLARQATTLQQGMYLIGTVYNFCTYHQSLRIPSPQTGLRWSQRTPAMAAGITDHCWTVCELLSFRVPPSPWMPPRRRGRPSNATKQLVTRWCA
jgi:transposase-like protein/IS1 family transposase